MRSTLVLAAAILTAAAHAVQPTADERFTAHTWAVNRFTPATEWTFGSGIEILSNHDPVQKNNRFGKPLHIGDATFEHGLFCHAQSKLVVHLAKPGKRLTGVVGVDLNPDTAGGQGSVVFSVHAGGKDLYQSAIIRGKEPGVPVDIDLGGAQTFILAVDDGGDGISSDQGDWANLRITLENGEQLWLDDLPMATSPVNLAAGSLPFSFVYGGKPSSELLKSWKPAFSSRTRDDQATEFTASWTDPESMLEVQCVAVQYADYPVVEWSLHFKNTGSADSHIIENILPLDMALERGDRGEFTLHHARGSACRQDDFAPLTSSLAPSSTFRLAPDGGRSSNGVMPYFNIESTCRDGALFAIGWPGQWFAEFARDATKTLHLTSGQEQTHFKLLPGEVARTPLIAVQFWNGDLARAHNLWRAWMFAHGMTRPGGQPPKPQFLGCSSRAYEEMIKADTASQKMFIDRYKEEGITLDYWWMDAGWYVQQKGWPQVGTWEVDKSRFPGGLRPISDHAHANGVKILVWFEPERVAADTWLTQNHPEWILGGANGGLLNLGNPDAQRWLTDHVNGLIDSEGIDLYRQDFNMDPLGLWRANDAPDRQGITEIKHITGLLAYWDEILKWHPGMLLDTCASGGRRIDLETARRALPLWRSDYAFEPIGHQGMTYGLSLWLPYHGTGTVGCVDAPYYGGGKTPVEPYAFWSNAAPSLNCGIDMRVKDIDYPAFRSLVDQWRAINKFYYGDFYGLTPFTLEKDAWLAWQFHLPETDEGTVQVFRRAGSAYTAAEFPLNALDPAAIYEVTELGSGETSPVPGKTLLERGIEISISARPGVNVYTYRKTN